MENADSFRYAFSTLASRFLPGFEVCDTYHLRYLNVLLLLMTMLVTYDSRALITRIWKHDATLGSPSDPNFKVVLPIALHTAANITLFPPLFFFSGLFYTDVISTYAIVLMYKLYLGRTGAYHDSAHGLWQLYVVGIISLTMRQTNIFWAAVFMGGLEAVRTIKSGECGFLGEGQTWRQMVETAVGQYKVGRIHDVALGDAGVLGMSYPTQNQGITNISDFVLGIISITVAVLYRPVVVLIRLWPYVALLASFGAFVFLNGGVVLGMSPHSPAFQILTLNSKATNQTM